MIYNCWLTQTKNRSILFILITLIKLITLLDKENYMQIRNASATEPLYLNWLNAPVGRTLAASETVTIDDAYSQNVYLRAAKTAGLIAVVAGSFSTASMDFVVQDELAVTAMKKIDYVAALTEPTVSQAQGMLVWKNTTNNKRYLLFSETGVIGSQYGVELSKTN